MQHRRSLRRRPSLCLLALLPWLSLFPSGAFAADDGEILLAQASSTEGELSEEELDAAAAESTGPPPGVEVMRVRGRGIAGVVTEVPSSVTTFDAATIEALGAEDVSDLARVTPNVQIVQPGATQANFFVRGIGLSDFSANSTGAVTIFQDHVALNAPAIQTGQLFDISNVEILRGPQGTGPYRNASAGAISVSSNLPTGNYGAQLRASLGTYAPDSGKGAHMGLIQDYEGYLEAPLIEDVLSSRFAFRFRNSDPYKTNGCGDAIPYNQRAVRPNNTALLDVLDICGERGTDTWPNFPPQISSIPIGLQDKVQFENNWAARGFLRFQPRETEMDFVLSAHGSRLDQDQVYGQALGNGTFQGSSQNTLGGTVVSQYWEPDQQREIRAGCPAGTSCSASFLASVAEKLASGRPLDEKPYRGDYNKDGVTKRDAWGSFVRGDMKLGDLDLFTLASYDTYDRKRDQDSDFVPDTLFEVTEDDQAWQTYEEVHLGGELPTTPFDWEVGGYYLQESLDSDSTTILRGLTPTSRNAIARTFFQDTTAFGVWASFAWEFLDDLTLEGGVRYNWESKEFELTRQQTLFGTPQRPQSNHQTETWNTPTGNLTLTYHLNQDVSTYVKYARGFKAGHFNALASEDIDRPAADPEYNDAWEAGLNGSWFDRRLYARASYFYYRYKDYQLFIFRDQANSPPVLEIVNAKEAENYGIELEGRYEPLRGWVPRSVEGLQLSANFSWLHGEFLDFQLRSTVQQGFNIVPVITDFSGNQLPNSPPYKFSGSAVWTFDLGRWGYLIPRYDVSWTDDVFYGPNNGRGSVNPFTGQELPDNSIGQAAYWLHNVRLTYRTPTTNVEISGWCRNVTDEVYKTFAFDASRFSGVVLNFVGEPRTAGVDVVIRF